MKQQNLEINTDHTFLARLFATVLTPFFGSERDTVSMREMNAAFANAQIDPIFAHSFEVHLTPECSNEHFEVAVSFTEGTSCERTLIYITEHDMALGEVDALEEFAQAINVHGRQLAILMDKARSCNANPRDIAMANTHFEDAFFRLRRSTVEDIVDGY